MMYSDGIDRKQEPVLNWTVRLAVSKIQAEQRALLERDNQTMRRLLAEPIKARSAAA